MHISSKVKRVGFVFLFARTLIYDVWPNQRVVSLATTRLFLLFRCSKGRERLTYLSSRLV